MEAFNDHHIPVDKATDPSATEANLGDSSDSALHLHLAANYAPSPFAPTEPIEVDPFAERTPLEATNPNGTW